MCKNQHNDPWVYKFYSIQFDESRIFFVRLHLKLIYPFCCRYDTVCRTSLVIQVADKSLKCVCRDGRVMHMSYELQELRDLIFCQVQN